MKKSIALLLTCIMAVMPVLTGCGNTETTDTTDMEEAASALPENAHSSSRNAEDTLILYFSYSGNTQQIAKWIEEYTGADMIQLEAEEAYPDDYDACVERAEKEHADNARPALATDLSTLSEYNTVILGWPCWNYSCPMLILTMLEEYDFSGKTIIPFTTSDASGFSRSLDEMKEVCSDAAYEDNGLEIKSREVDSSQERVNKWLSELGFEKVETESKMENAKEVSQLTVTINGEEYTATLEDTQAAKELTGMLPLTLSMQEMNGNEKYADLPDSLTQQIYSPGEIHEGDILLWGADTLVIFYESFPTSYSYTAIGHIDDPSGIAEAVGSGSVEVTIDAR